MRRYKTYTHPRRSYNSASRYTVVFIYARNPLHQFSLNFPVWQLVTDLLRGNWCNGFWALVSCTAMYTQQYALLRNVKRAERWTRWNVWRRRRCAAAVSTTAPFKQWRRRQTRLLSGSACVDRRRWSCGTSVRSPAWCCSTWLQAQVTAFAQV